MWSSGCSGAERAASKKNPDQFLRADARSPPTSRSAIAAARWPTPANNTLLGALSDFAGQSQHPELATIPIFFVGRVLASIFAVSSLLAGLAYGGTNDKIQRDARGRPARRR